MFQCYFCKESSAAREPAVRVVLERRVKVYPKGGGESVEGSEIVREALAHSGCALTFEGKARGEEEAARKASAGGATLADAFRDMHAVEDYSAHPDAAPPFDPEHSPGMTDLMVDPETIDVSDLPVPVPAAKLEEVFSKPKKQKRAKKVKKAKKDEEVN